MATDGPLIVQSNLEVLVEVEHPRYAEARDSIAPFTELVKSPEHLHTYRISHLSLWNAASVGLTSEEVLERLHTLSRYPVPQSVVAEVEEYMGRYGKVRMLRDPARQGGGPSEGLFLETDDPQLLHELARNRDIAPWLGTELSPNRCAVLPGSRGPLKMAMAKSGFPVEDLAGYVEGEPLPMALRSSLADIGTSFRLRDYQAEAAQVFYSSGSAKGGSGVIVLPCGSGKTVIGMAAMALVQARTLVVTPNITAARQWIRELLQKTTLTADQVKEYSGEVKEIGPVTVATYQILTHRSKPASKKPGRKSAAQEEEPVLPATPEEAKVEGDVFSHFPLLANHAWGLIIYDEVHLLPAPVFRFSAEVQATRRLGLTATLVREDGREREVFSLIGPKKYDIPWRILEAQGWIASAICHEVRVPMLVDRKMEYAVADMRDKIRLASCNPVKESALDALLALHHDPEDRVLVIGQYIEQIEAIATARNIPIITGKTPNREREEVYERFRKGAIRTLVVSKVGNFAIDLPDASVLIQVSGTFGSRQEEAQRLGRVLRPKKDGRQAMFYSLVTRETREQEFAMNRQLFLAEQGYAYKILQWRHGMTGEELLASVGQG